MYDPPDSIHGTARPAAADTASDHSAHPTHRDWDRLGRGVGGGGQHRFGCVAGIEGSSCERDRWEHGSPTVCELDEAWGVWLAPSTRAPGTWTRHTVASDLGALSSPPGFHTVDGDPGTLSVALGNSAGTYLGYLNVTPHQGHETLQDWAAFRLSHLFGDDAISVHEDATVHSVRTAAALRSYVIDDYVTTIGHHRFHEVACYVTSDSVSSVVVAATPSGDPAHVWTQLERAVAAYPFD